MRILAIEDNEAKLAALNALVYEVDGNATLKHCDNIREALIELDVAMYDLVILDLMMPLTKDGSPQDTGKEILQIISASRLNRTTNIVALTAYKELYELQEEEFSQAGVVLVHYDGISNEWKKTIKSFLRRVSVLPRCDFVIVCALDIERNALVGTRAQVGVQKRENGFDVREIKIGDHKGNVILLPRTGLIDVSIIASSAMERYRPRLIAMSGICAGVKNRVKMGQVLVCATCWEYQVGKSPSQLDKFGAWCCTQEGFEFEPYQSTVAEPVRQILLALCRSDKISEIIYGDGLPPGVERCKPSLATMVSGSAVVADEGTRDFIQAQHRKIDAIEMELAGLFRAVSLLDDSVIVIGVKGVSDFADSRKTDDIRDFAATASARFVVEAIDKLLEDRCHT